MAQAITPRTRAVLVVHQFGLPADLDALHAVAREHGCAVIEDAACALGSTYKGRRIGTHSKLVCYSFHPRKVITTGEGGMIVTDDDALADRLRRLRHHGMDQTDWQRHQQAFPQREQYVETGFNYRMSDLSAAVGLAQMARLDELIARRRQLAMRLTENLQGHPYLTLPVCSYEACSNGQTFAVVARRDVPLNRDALVSYLRRRGIGAKTGLACIHQEPCYRDDYPDMRLPRSESLARRMLLLPLHPGMTDADQTHIIDALIDVLWVQPRHLPLRQVSVPNAARMSDTLFERPQAPVAVVATEPI